MAKQLPNVVVIGTQKGGTTALYNWISQHPQVYGDATMKDFPFFCNDEYYKRGLDWFADCFGRWDGEPVVLHGYVHYLYLYAETAERLRRFNPELKLIVSLRNPAERAYSAFLQARKTGNEPLARFEDAIAREADETGGSFSDKTNRSYVQHGFYYQQLSHFFSVFPRDQVHIVRFEDMSSDPDEVCASIFRFLDVNPQFKPDARRMNDHAEARSKLVQQVIARGVVTDGLREIVPINTRIRIRRFINGLNLRPVEKPAMERETRAKLGAIYLQDIEQLETLTGLTLDAWKAPGARDGSAASVS